MLDYYIITHAVQLNLQAEVITGISFGGGATSQPIHFESPMCSGDERNLTDCQYVVPHDCDKPEDVGIICQRSAGITLLQYKCHG